MTASTLLREHPLPTIGRRTLMDPVQLGRFFSKVEKVVIEPAYGECWVWMPPSQSGGYGRLYLGTDGNGKQLYVASHIGSYMHFVGPVPADWVVDHMCNHKACVNPKHLEAITNLENLKRAHERRPWRRHNQYETDHTAERDWRHDL